MHMHVDLSIATAAPGPSHSSCRTSQDTLPLSLTQYLYDPDTLPSSANSEIQDPIYQLIETGRL